MFVYVTQYVRKRYSFYKSLTYTLTITYSITFLSGASF